jgi:endonuclease YncB( thermonuclease family)
VASEQHDIDRYGRIVAVCRAGAEDLNAWLVSQGLALAYRQYSTVYVDEEAAAGAARLGIRYRPSRPLSECPAVQVDRAPWRGVRAAAVSRSPAGLAGFVRQPRQAA